MESKIKSLEQNQTNTVMALLSVQTAIKFLLSLKALLFGKHSPLSAGMLKQFELEPHIHPMSLLCVSVQLRSTTHVVLTKSQCNIRGLRKVA